MFEFLNYSADKLILLLLIIIRTSGMFITSPFWGDRGIPALVKVGLIIILSLILLPTIPNQSSFSEINSMWQLVGLAFNEMLIGFIIGLFFRFIFIGVMIAGTLIGYQMGFMFATMFDSNQSNQISFIGRFWYIVAILFFLAINGHHMIINAFVESYQVIPAGNVGINGFVAEMIIKYSAYIFIVALKVASPIIATLFLTDIALGTIAKTMPTMNVFFVGMPIKISVGFLVMAMSLPLMVYVLEKAMGYFDNGLRLVLYSIGKA